MDSFGTAAVIEAEWEMDLISRFRGGLNHRVWDAIHRTSPSVEIHIDRWELFSGLLFIFNVLGVCWLLALTFLSNRRWKILFISVTLWKNYWHSFYPSLCLRKKLDHTRDSGMPSSHSVCCSFKGLSVKNCSASPLSFSVLPPSPHQSTGSGPYCWEHSVVLGRQITVCCWACVQGVVPCDVGWHAMEEAHRENGQDRLSVERPGRAQRVVSLYPSFLLPQHSRSGHCTLLSVGSQGRRLASFMVIVPISNWKYKRIVVRVLNSSSLTRQSLWHILLILLYKRTLTTSSFKVFCSLDRKWDSTKKGQFVRQVGQLWVR